MKISDLSPTPLWENFEKILAIPRPSKKEKRIIAFMKNFGESLGLETIEDHAGNVIIRKPATPGMENRKGVILQGHLDMVPQKNADTVHNFETDPIQAYIDGDWVKARGTTLGADNGMGVAAAMAILASGDLPHGPVEALFTVDEETGMTGAFELKGGMLKGDILLNLDSEDEGELYVGCAGGTNATMNFSFKPENTPPEHTAFHISLRGMEGGHSGLNINLGRGNANLLLFRYLYHAARRHGLRIASVEGGNLRNAIPREAFATVVVPNEKVDKFKKCLRENAERYRQELKVTEPNLSLSAEETALPAAIMDADAQNRLIAAVYACPNGVIRMSDTMPGLVETSTNLAVVKSENNTVNVLCLLRSSVDSAKEDLASKITALFEMAGAEVRLDGTYPGWKPNPDSAILTLMKETYTRHFGIVPEIKAIHAGLECGILSTNYPHWDMISFGPTMKFPHSPDEKVNIPSVQKFWDFLVLTLQNIPVKEALA